VTGVGIQDPGACAERRAQRIIAARDRRRAALRAGRWILRLLAAACVAAALVPTTPALVLLACAVVLACAAGAAGALTPAVLGPRARAQITVREAWRAVRHDGDRPAGHERHAIWAAEADDGTVRLWRLTRRAGRERAADGGYLVHATPLCSLDARDTVAAAAAMEDARADAASDEQAAVDAHERPAADPALLIEARGLARALRAVQGP
jgi:hypothetical protein